MGVIEVGSRQRTQPAPPQIIYEALAHPDRDRGRPWLELLDDEQQPRVEWDEPPSVVVWSSLWVKRPDAVVRFDLSAHGSETNLRWSLYVDEPAPDDSRLGHMRRRVNYLINSGLRHTLGQ